MQQQGGDIPMTGGHCVACNGQGGKATPTGQAIFDFLARMKRAGRHL